MSPWGDQVSVVESPFTPQPPLEVMVRVNMCMCMVGV